MNRHGSGMYGPKYGGGQSVFTVRLARPDKGERAPGKPWNELSRGAKYNRLRKQRDAIWAEEEDAKSPAPKRGAKITLPYVRCLDDNYERNMQLAREAAPMEEETNVDSQTEDAEDQR